MQGASKLEQIIQNEDQICKLIRGNFLKIQGEVRQNRAKEKPLSEQIQFIINQVFINVGQPVQILKSLGILIFNKAIAFQFSVFTANIIVPKTIMIQKLKAENWKLAGTSYDQKIASLIGQNELKNWTAFELPDNCPLVHFIESNPNLIASEACFGLDTHPKFPFIGPGMPPEDVLIEPHFPLVSIQYERVTENELILHYEPSGTTPINKKSWNITPAKHFEIV
ncbi:hypothetical protein TVAG_379000 [Trichomonas vaginalis G3]|uniref:Initiator binding domain-containing protein n=1 Tax=Trichomonas vaginalis (strain ATCC PRA-98 / G3) TaxID=412133 RepID=A2DB91_TRIV3|nr:hypothetical protein TVAGG3_0508850 [Trichomonas vaginalis G3]EAY22421.1 hypothetical protein TVAG_379000 [Trichomonas vaginalis G3]KAI5517632.1 hypothetical protein TVAGG3_0508850 [Trichomonas vaginalis G3]|eukprot:XP_001583407.1 hypothetical protein [Trichomonas vaginalis G3]